jgi:hypothetical protein
MANAPSSTRDRALSLLGQGISAAHVAAACGVTESAISQLLADEGFASEVATARYSALSKHNERDCKYDGIEDRLIDKLEDLLPMMMRPMEVLKSIQVINAAKRRGSSAPENITEQTTVVQIIMPQLAISKFVANQQNQVIRAGDQDLLTIQSGTLLKQAKGAQDDDIKQRALTNSLDL